MENRPQGREKHVNGTGKDIYKHGSGVGGGPVGGRPSGQAGRGAPSGGRAPSGGGPRSSYPGQTQYSGRAARSGGSPLIKIIIAVVVLLGGGGFGLNSLLGGGGSSDVPDIGGYEQSYTGSYSQQQPGGTGGLDLGSLLGGFAGGGSSIGNVSSGWSGRDNTGRLNTSVDPAARPKRTAIIGGGRDEVTVMVYMCGSDLESKSGMGSKDIREMTAATLSDNVNLLLYTGGSKQWNNNVVSSSYNQIYKVENGTLSCLVSNDGTAAMTDPATLTGFIRYCAEHYPANRNELIFWDHGGGSVSGYGYDEKKPSSGSMNLKNIDKALSDAGVTFDFIGFDACLMGTLENALTLAPHADYLIASEETEPGVGWYYTDWLTSLSSNTSTATLDVGKNIVDGFVTECSRSCPGQKTTLSVIDLAELEKTVPDKFRDFALDLSGLMNDREYKTLSDARSETREFAVSSKVDQVDLVHLAYNIGSDESRALAETVLGAVKYNRTCSSITDAYGLSIYFPYRKLSRVDSAVAAYDALGLDSEYSRCIQRFAGMEAAGQATSSAASSPLSSLQGGSPASLPGGDMLSGILGGLLGGDLSGLSGGLSGLSGAGFLGRGLDAESAAEYLADHRFDPSLLSWRREGSSYVMSLPESQWAMVEDLELNVFYDDGYGYIDLGLDNVFDFTDDGALIGEYDGSWIAVNGQHVAYYHTDTLLTDDGYIITGRIPVLLNGSRAELIAVFDSSLPDGYIAGVRSDYRNGETETVAKSVSELEYGDVISFLCDYYSYDGAYTDSYRLGEDIVYDGELTVSDMYLSDPANTSAAYLFTDIYCGEHWTPVIP